MKNFTRAMALVFVSFFLFSASFGQTILVVDRDGSSWAPDSFTDCWPWFEAALDELDYDYEYYEVLLAEDDGPDYDYMGDFDIVIWFCGEVWADRSSLTENDEQNLGYYLDDGGYLFLSAQDYLWDAWGGGFGEGDFPWDYLGLRTVVQDVWQIVTPDVASIDGVEGSVASGLAFDVQDIFTASARENLYIDDITEHVGMDMFDLWSPDPAGVPGIQYDAGDWKAVFTTASYAAITDGGIQEDLLEAIVNWFMGGGGSECFPHFDSYEAMAAGDYLAVVDDCWDTWSGAPGGAEDAMITDVEGYSGMQSVYVEGSSTDLIFDLGHETAGAYVVSMDIMVAEGFGGYYNLMHSFGATNEWAFEAYFASDGTGYINAGGESAATFTFTNGEWFNSRVHVDLDADWAMYFLNDELIYEWQWSLTATGGAGLNQLGVVDVYAAAPGSDSPSFYFDNFYYYPDDGCDLFDQYDIGDYVGLQSPFFTTWSNAPGTAEDAMVTFDTDPYPSLLIDGTVDLVHNFSYMNLESGIYSYAFWFMVEPGFCGYFNLQKTMTPGQEWGFQMQWDVDGVATADAGAAAAFTYNYTQGEWYYVDLVVDLDGDYCEIWIDDELLWTYQWTLGTFGNPGLLSLGGSNIYAWASTGNSPMAYFDDYCFTELDNTGIGTQPAHESSFQVYPNPAYNYINVKSNNDIQEVKIFNNIGQVVYSEVVKDIKTQINISDLKAGIYHVQVLSGDKLETTKLMIK